MSKDYEIDRRPRITFDTSQENINFLNDVFPPHGWRSRIFDLLTDRLIELIKTKGKPSAVAAIINGNIKIVITEDEDET